MIKPEVSEVQQQNITALSAEVDSLEAQVAAAKASVGDEAVVNGDYTSTNADGSRRSNVDSQQERREIRSRVRAEKAETLAMRRLLDSKKAELRNAKAQTEPMKLITASRDGVTYLLMVPDVLSNIEVSPKLKGVSWRGELVEAGNGEQRWLVSKVEPLTDAELMALESNPQ